MKHKLHNLDNITALTLEYYNQYAEDFAQEPVITTLARTSRRFYGTSTLSRRSVFSIWLRTGT